MRAGEETLARLKRGLESARPGCLAIIGLPFDENSSFMRGPANAPPLIRENLFSESTHLWTENGLNLGAEGVLCDLGDLDLSDKGQAFELIEAAIVMILEARLKPVCLGGDHSVSLPILKAFRGFYPRLNLVHFDAHPDLYHDFLGNPHSHASPFARIMEQRLADRLVQVGLRATNDHQRQQALRFGVESFEMANWPEKPDWRFEGPVYLSFDLDALDPAFAPGVSHHEPGGLSTRQAISLIQGLKGQIVGADIVELNPNRDPIGITAMAAAKIFKEIAGQILA